VGFFRQTRRRICQEKVAVFRADFAAGIAGKIGQLFVDLYRNKLRPFITPSAPRNGAPTSAILPRLAQEFAFPRIFGGSPSETGPASYDGK